MAHEGGIVIQPSVEIAKHFRLEVFDSTPKHKSTLMGLLQNGLYYMTVGNSVSALASFSSAASYVYALKTDAGETTKYDSILNSLLGYVEKLQVEARKGGSGGGGGGGGGGGKSKDEDSKNEWDVECETFGCEEDPAKNCLTFKDVVGMKKEKETFFAAISYPIIYPNLYTKAAKGLLLYGPPGTGKTFLIKAAVRELGMAFPEVKVLFFPLTGADLKGKYVGETEKKIVRAYTCAARRACQMTDVYNDVHPKQCLDRIHKDFEEKRAQAASEGKESDVWKKHPQYVSVVFIDEFDAVGGDRSKDETGVTANAVNTMLQMMDGLQSFGNVITVCATNFPWNLDSALLRRFNEQIYCNVPNMEDVKTLVTVEQKNRLKYFDESKRKYCAGPKMEKFFKASDQMKELTGNKTLTEEEKKAKAEKDAAKDPCIIDSNGGSIIDLIDKSYLNDKSAALTAAVSEMAEKHYSNSDVSSVMQKAFNIVSASALRSSLWQKVNYKNPKTGEDEMYWVSRLTKLTGNAQTKLDQSLLAIENEASFDSIYESGRTNVLNIPENIYMDDSSIKSIFDEKVPDDKIELKITSLKINRPSFDLIQRDAQGIRDKDAKGQYKLDHVNNNGLVTYTNMNFIANLPPILMFNDPTISQVFFNADQVAYLDQEIKNRKKNKTTTPSQTEIDVIFTRVLDIEYSGVMPSNSDAMNLYIRGAAILLDKIEQGLIGKEHTGVFVKEVEALEAEVNTVLEQFFTYIKLPDEGSPDYVEYEEQCEFIEEAMEAEEHRTEVFTVVDKKIAYTNDNYTVEGDKKGRSAAALTLRSLEPVEVSEGFKKVCAKLYWAENLGPIDSLDEGKLRALINDVLLYNQNFIKFIEPSGLLRLNNSKSEDSDNFKKNSGAYKEYIKNGVARLNSPGKLIFEGEPYKTKKLFFFDAKIHPLSADWVQFKASGPGLTGGKNVLDLVTGLFSGIKSKLVSAFSGKDVNVDNLETTVAARIAESSIPLSKYLLTRTNRIGVMDVSDEKNILIVDKGGIFKETGSPASSRRSSFSDPGSGDVAVSESNSDEVQPLVKSQSKSGKKGGARKTKKLKRGGSAKTATRRNNATFDAKKFQYKYIHWFDINSGANPARFKPEHINLGHMVLEGLTDTAIGATAFGGATAIGAGASYLGVTSISSVLTGPLAYLGITVGVVPVIGLAVAAGLSFTFLKGIFKSESHLTNIGSAAERLLFNQMLGYWYTFNKPEDNIYITNLMVAEIFGGESLEIQNAGAESHWVDKLPDIFAENYLTALKSRERIFTQITEYARLDKVEVKDDAKSVVNIKQINTSNTDAKNLNKSNFLSFYMDASFITAAMKSYPSTYNPVTGGQLQDYNKNRTKFLEDYAAGKYDKKK
jgi:SpoVK/Ycf46/Vps4 family AAA+-type ATPase